MPPGQKYTRSIFIYLWRNQRRSEEIAQLMPSPPSSVIVLDDSSDEEAAVGASGRRSAPLLVSSSDDSDTGRPSQPKKPRVASPKFSFSAAPTVRKGLSSESASSEEEPSDSQEDESDVSEASAPRGKKKQKKATQKKKTEISAAQSSATTDSDNYTHKEPTQLKFAASDGRMYSDAMSFSELQAQQREFERLQAKAHRASKSVPHNTARRTTTAGTKRKTSDAVAATFSSVMKKSTSPSPFDFDFPGSDDESSASSSSPTSSAQEDKRAAPSSARAKHMSLKDIVAQERELARLRNKNAKKTSQTAPPKKKPAASNSSVPKPSFSFFGSQKSDNIIDATEWSSSEPSGDEDDDIEFKPKSSSQPAPFANDSFSESDDENLSEEEYAPTETKHRGKSPAPHVSQHAKSAKVTKGKKTNAPKNSSKSKTKTRKSKARSSSSKSESHASLPAPAGVFSDKLARPRTARDTVMHSTVWRNVCFDAAPPNLLPLDSSVTLPFHSGSDRPLLTYDVDGDLRSKCKLLPRFGDSASVLVSDEPEQVITQEDMDTRVTELIQRELPRIRACHQRKATAMLAEARSKVRTYLTAQEMLREDVRLESKRLGEVDTLDRSLLNQMKQEKLTQSLSVGYVNVWGETVSVEEKLFPQDVNQLPNIRPLSRCTAYIGLKTNVRVEDDPILRYMPYFGDNDDGADIDVAWYDSIAPEDSNLSSGLDGEVNEYLLRLVVRECGTSEKVFNALKKVPGFGQAYSDYSEIKKLDDSTRLAARRIKEAKELISSKPASFPLAKVAALEPSLRDVEDSQKTLQERFSPPPTYFDSNLSRSHANRGYGLGLRSTADYTELLVTYRDMFCRMCYDYHCLEHGIEHPLPSHRVDPINPPLHLSAVALAAHAKKAPEDVREASDRTPESATSTTSPSADTPDSGSCTADENFKHDDTRSHDGEVQTDEDATMEQVSSEACYETVTDEEVATTASRSLKKQTVQPSRRKQSRPQRVQVYPQVADESEYLDDSHYARVTSIVKKSLKEGKKCSNECWKSESTNTMAGTENSSDKLECASKFLSDTELVILRKLRSIIGDNPCIISSMINSTTCKEVGTFLESERQSKPNCTSSMDDMPLSPDVRSSNNGRKRARTSRSSNNRILLNRTRNNRLKDKGANHEYEPCNHEGACDRAGCTCMTRDHTCDKACSCSRDCPNRFPGCRCSLGNCRTKACPCFVAARECNPDLCVTCGASEVAALIFDEERRNMSALELGICCNVNILRGLHKKVGVAYSTTHGWGAFALEPIKRGEFIYEYHGALLSQDEAERRGSIYDKMTISFLFDVDDDSVVDAIRKGNKSKFANHSAVNKKCKGKVLTVGGEHRISIWAQQDIAKGEELFFDYGYHGETAPDWSQLRIKGSTRYGPKKKNGCGGGQEEPALRVHLCEDSATSMNACIISLHVVIQKSLSEVSAERDVGVAGRLNRNKYKYKNLRNTQWL
ncbi:hypothetical protein PF011_g22450 [Phytophthora fragariae]|uniref:Uncharacterized protein n=1 Tax=Phytophthora fragariae TaxID=53985 RepID=A0A6A3IEN3_9STRA|nr:hypothetical protein PF011_g22450 [Phytophthora fragariae]